MTKRLSADTVIMLYNKLGSLLPRDKERRLIIEETAQLYGVSFSTVYRALRRYNKPKTVCRADYNQPRLSSQAEMRRYCELIAALKLRTSNKKERHLSTRECIRLLETYGIEEGNTLIKAPVGLLKKTTVNVYLKRFYLDKASLKIQPTVVHFEAEHSNDCWHFDFSHSDFKHFPDDKQKRESEENPVLMLLSVVDDRSGVMYQEYHYICGEDTMTALKFLFNAMAPKKVPGIPFQGIPKVFYLDNGPVAKSIVFKRVMAYLNIEIITHLPDGKDGRRKTARSKGKVERPFRTVKESLESLYNLHPPKDLAEANEWLHNYLQRYNQEKHRREDHSRLEDWKRNLPSEGFKEMCSWERYSTLARDPETRKVASDACVSINGIKYQLSGELAGLTVTLLWGVFDNELRVEHEGKHYGPFYPADGPIPFGQYRPFKKNHREKYIDRIELLSKSISIPRTALSNDNLPTEKLLNSAGLIEEHQVSVPFTTPAPFEQDIFKDTIEAKAAVARWLGRPLGCLLPQQLDKINVIINESLDKQLIMVQIKQLFEIKLIATSGEK